jgi:hypothetical protein
MDLESDIFSLPRTVKAGACFISRWPEEEFRGQIEHLVGQAVIESAINSAEIINNSTPPVENQLDLQELTKKNPAIKDLITVLADLIKQSGGQSSKQWSINNFISAKTVEYSVNSSIGAASIAYPLAGNFPRVLFNAVIFQYGKRITKAKFEELTRAITDHNDSPFIQNNDELNRWLTAKSADFNKK